MLVKVTDYVGRELAFTYNPGMQINSVRDPAGGVYELSYVGDHLEKVAYPGPAPKPTRIYLYAYATGNNTKLKHALTGIKDENNTQFATYSYDPQTGRAVSTEHAGGAGKLTVSYSATASVVTDALGTSRSYGFDIKLGQAKVSAVSQPCASCGGPTTAYSSYDPQGFVASETDFNGRVTVYQRDDPFGRRDLPTSRIEAVSTAVERTVTTEWHPDFRLPLKISGSGRETRRSYDANGNMLTRTVTDIASGRSRTWTYTYDGNGQVTSVDGPRTDIDDITTYSYYPNDDPDVGRRGGLATVTDALGHITQISAYDAHGHLLQTIDPNGLVTTLAYDLRGRLKTSNHGGRLTAYNYDNAGNLIAVVFPDGTHVAYGYDAAHRVTSVTDQLGNRRVFTLDASGNVTRDDLRDPQDNLVRTHTRVFDGLGRLQRQIDALNNATALDYDAQGNLTTVTDPGQHRTAYGYDALNRLVRVTDALSGVTTFLPNGLDQLTQAAAPNNAKTQYQIDAVGNVLSETSPDRGTTSYTYDAAGNLETRTDARGIQVSFAYDALNRLTQVTYPDPGEDLTLTYDAGPNCGAGKGRLCSVQDASGTTQYSYDVFGNVATVTRRELGVDYSQTFGYDSLDRLTSQVTPDNQAISIPRDALGRPTELTAPVAGQATSVLSQLVWLADNQLASQGFANQTRQTLSYDAAGRVQSSQSTPDPATTDSVPTLPQWGTLLLGLLLAGLGLRARRCPPQRAAPLMLLGLLAGLLTTVGPSIVLAQENRTLGHDADGNLTSQTTTRGSNTYGYDPLHRLTSETGPAATQTFTYDANGNRLSDAAGNYALLPDSNRYHSMRGASVQYDAAGNLTDDGSGRTFTYNQAGRLSQVRINGTLVASFAYDYLGRRTRKTTAAGTTVYNYDVQGRLVYESQSNGAPLARYLYRDRMPVAKVDAPNTADNPLPTERITYLTTDQLGTPRTGTDASERLVWRWESDAFGARAPEEDPDRDGRRTVINLRFPGQYFDKETGLHYNYFRDYDPQTGRYIQPDPIGLAGGVNLYGYVGSMPTRFVDPYGLDVGEPGLGEGFIPVWGSGRQAINDFQTGHYVWGSVNSIAALSDVALVGYGVKAVCKGAWKLGSHTWGATRKWYGKTRELPPNTPVHHWGIPQGGWGKQVPDIIKNQPWNLNPMPDWATHADIHGYGPDPYNAVGRWWYGTPDWAKIGEGSLAGKAGNALRDDECNCAQ